MMKMISKIKPVKFIIYGFSSLLVLGLIGYFTDLFYDLELVIFALLVLFILFAAIIGVINTINENSPDDKEKFFNKKIKESNYNRIEDMPYEIRIDFIFKTTQEWNNLKLKINK